MIQAVSLIAILFPLIGAAIAGIGGKIIGRKASHSITILGIGIAFVCSLYIFMQTMIYEMPAYDANLYTWGSSGRFNFSVGLLIDRLTAVMMVTVTFVSLLVHIYSIGYMRDDPG